MARLTKDAWESLKAEYATGAYTLQELAKRYGISHAAISKRIKKEKWGKLDSEESIDIVEKKKVTKSYENKVTKVTKKLQINKTKFDNAIDRLAEIKQKAEDNALKILNKSSEMIEVCEGADDLEKHARINKNIVDAHFKQNNQINIQNNQNVAIPTIQDMYKK